MTEAVFSTAARGPDAKGQTNGSFFRTLSQPGSQDLGEPISEAHNSIQVLSDDHFARLSKTESRIAILRCG